MNDRPITAALATLIVLQITMLFALFFKIPPHPPEVIPLGGMAPVIAASLCAALAGWILRHDGLVGKILIVVACLTAALSYGPQKFFDPAFPLVWPAVIAAQIAIVTLLFQVGRGVVTTLNGEG